MAHDEKVRRMLGGTSSGTCETMRKGAMPMHGTRISSMSESQLWSVWPTSFITPDDVPPVMIHATVLSEPEAPSSSRSSSTTDVARIASSSPRLKTFSCDETRAVHTGSPQCTDGRCTAGV